MILHPNCKINLGLRVVRKREDGYHDLETVFVPIYRLHDELEVTPSTELLFHQEGIAVDCKAEDNLIIKCYHFFKQKYPQIGPVEIRFKKNIPFGAGLGGGSSDAAHMAIALNELFGLGLSKEKLANEVRVLGADCAFFIYNRPCFAEGIGDILTPIEAKLKGTRIVLVKPEEGVSTKEAYSGIHPSPCPSLKETVMKGIDKAALIANQSLFVNDFESTVLPNHPVIACIKKRLLAAGAFYASMSGSGSTVFGLFENDPEGRTNTDLRVLEQEFPSMILLNDTFGEWQS